MIKEIEFFIFDCSNWRMIDSSICQLFSSEYVSAFLEEIFLIIPILYLKNKVMVSGLWVVDSTVESLPLKIMILLEIYKVT